MPVAEPLVTVVVLNWNGAHLLGDCLDGLAAQDLPEGQAAVWVVDNASTDGSLELLAERFPWVRVIANPSNAGFAGGNNVALREVATPFVALLNNDARPEPDWLRRLLEPFGEPGAERLGAVSGKIVFLPRFLAVELATPGFVPGTLDTRDLGVRIYRVTVDGTDVTERVLWDRVAYGPEGEGPGRFRWTRPAGMLLVPVDRPGGHPAGPGGPLRLALRIAAETTKPVELTWSGGSGGGKAEPEPVDLEVEVPAGVPLLDVLNNAGSMVFRDGYGADRAYQELDRGQYERPEEVFAFCGGSVCFRTEALQQAGTFDDDFFLYYEDTDLSWRLRALGWRIRYQPAAVARHIHSASSVEWSPLFVFHTDRNRLLMLTKNARAGLAAREVLRYPLTTASLALREVARSRHTRRRPPVRPTLLRLRVLGSYLRLLPVMLVRRRRIAARAAVDRKRLERWLVLR
ncbi:MAG TPA: glycosyltransferase family 2 protein [Actinomycetota bacterium]|nr:glycosyltransferase family 2 protein [Actinomycetota bacterium]